MRYYSKPKSLAEGAGERFRRRQQEALFDLIRFLTTTVSTRLPEKDKRRSTGRMQRTAAEKNGMQRPDPPSEAQTGLGAGICDSHRRVRCP